MSMLQIEFYGDPCRSCGYSWSRDVESLVTEVLELGSTYRNALEDLPGMARHPDLGWSASAYVAHVADNLRLHGERMAAGARGASLEFVHPSQDDLALVRAYNSIPLESSLWSLENIVAPYVAVFRGATALQVVLPHPTRGDQSAEDVLRGNVHDAHHHTWDLRRIADANRGPAKARIDPPPEASKGEMS
jgi:hypothetical protein